MLALTKRKRRKRRKKMLLLLREEDGEVFVLCEIGLEQELEEQMRKNLKWKKPLRPHPPKKLGSENSKNSSERKKLVEREKLC